MNDALHGQNQCNRAMEDAESPIAPPSKVNENVSSSTEQEDEWKISRHEDTQSIGEDSADLSWDGFVAGSHVSPVSSNHKVQIINTY